MNLKPLDQILPPQQPAYQQPVAPQQPQYPQQQPVQQPASNTATYVMNNTGQMDQMRNNGRVELVVQDAQQGYVVISTDQLNIASIDMQNPQLGQELRLFDSNNDGWIVEQELKSAAVGQVPTQGGEKVGTFEHVASSTLGGGLFGGAVGGLANKFGVNLGAKFGVKGWVAGMAAGAAVGLVGGFLTNPNKKGAEETNQNYVNAYGYRNETQWNNNRLIKTIL